MNRQSAWERLTLLAALGLDKLEGMGMTGGFVSLRIGQMKGSCEGDNRLSGSLKIGWFIE